MRNSNLGDHINRKRLYNKNAVMIYWDFCWFDERNKKRISKQWHYSVYAIYELKVSLKLHLQRAEKAPHTLTISLIAPGTSPFSSLAILNQKFHQKCFSKIVIDFFYIHFLIDHWQHYDRKWRSAACALYPLNYNRSGTISQGGKLKPTLCSLCR